MSEVIPFERIRAYFFDLDGTLMDTDDEAVAKLAAKLRFLGEARARSLARRAVMAAETPLNGLITALDVVGLDPLLFALRRFVARHDEGGRLFPIIPGVEPLLRTLAAGHRLAIVSTRDEAAAEAFLRQYGLRDLFSLIVTQRSTPRLKPHPDPVRFAAARFGLPPSACVMVGDTPVDILAARRAGAWAVGVLCGFGEEEELWRAGAHLVLPSTADLLHHLAGTSSARAI